MRSSLSSWQNDNAVSLAKVMQVRELVELAPIAKPQPIFYKDSASQIDFASWTGEEFFYLKDSGATVCSLKVKELMGKNNITNVSFEDLDKY